MTQFSYQRRPSYDNSSIPSVIFALLVANGLVFAGQQFLPNHFLYFFALWPLQSDVPPFQFWQVLSYYLTCVAGAGLVQLVVASLQGGVYPTVGASGGIFGILLAYAMFFPNNTVMLLFPPIPMRAKYFVLFFGLLELYLGVSGRSPGVANFAHLGGMLFGFILLRYWRSRARR